MKTVSGTLQISGYINTHPSILYEIKGNSIQRKIITVYFYYRIASLFFFSYFSFYSFKHFKNQAVK